MFFKYKKRTQKTKRGFTLVELLVVFFIMGTILAVIVPDYLTYSTQLELENLALDVALTIREAQVYGGGAKVSSTGDFNTSYGVHFERGANSFIFFENTSEGGNNKGVYSPPPGGDTIISTIMMKNGYAINALCRPHPSNGTTVCDAMGLDIVFKRPNPEAGIKYNNISGLVSGYAGENSYGSIILISPDQATTTIEVSSTGSISIQR